MSVFCWCRQQALLLCLKVEENDRLWGRTAWFSPGRAACSYRRTLPNRTYSLVDSDFSLVKYLSAARRPFRRQESRIHGHCIIISMTSCREETDIHLAVDMDLQ